METYLTNNRIGVDKGRMTSEVSRGPMGQQRCLHHSQCAGSASHSPLSPPNHPCSNLLHHQNNEVRRDSEEPVQVASSTQQWVGSWCKCMTEEVWWSLKCLANVSTKVYCTELHLDGLRPGTAGAQLGHFSGAGPDNRPHTSAYRAAGNMAWHRKENLLGCTLNWRVWECHYSCHSDKRGGSRAGADGHVLPLHMVGDWSQRQQTQTQINSTKKLYSFLFSVIPDA